MLNSFVRNITRIKDSDKNEKDIDRKQRYLYLICDSINQTKLLIKWWLLTLLFKKIHLRRLDAQQVTIRATVRFYICFGYKLSYGYYLLLLFSKEKIQMF